MGTMVQYDVTVVGGGPAGLSGALYLGRACRRVRLIDSHDARNMAAGVLRSFVTNDGVTIDQFRQRARTELERYDVTVVDDHVESILPLEAAERTPTTEPGISSAGIATRTRSGVTVTSNAVLYAAGVCSSVPDIPGVAQLWGQKIVECPYCHGWEVRGQNLAVFEGPVNSLSLATMVRVWSPHVSYLSNGRALSGEDEEELQRVGVAHEPEPVRGFQDAPGGVTVVHTSGTCRQYDAVFMHVPMQPRVGPLEEWLGCRPLERVDDRGHTHLTGLYVAGDLIAQMPQAITAAASGAQAAMTINMALAQARVSS